MDDSHLKNVTLGALKSPVLPCPLHGPHLLQDWDLTRVPDPQAPGRAPEAAFGHEGHGPSESSVAHVHLAITADHPGAGIEGAALSEELEEAMRRWVLSSHLP